MLQIFDSGQRAEKGIEAPKTTPLATFRQLMLEIKLRSWNWQIREEPLLLRKFEKILTGQDFFLRHYNNVSIKQDINLRI